MLESTMSIKDRSVSNFPKLMIDRDVDLVVLFQDEERGVVVHTGSISWYVGQISFSFVPEDFEDFHGTITLTA